MTTVIALGAAGKVWLATLAMMAVQGTLLAIVALALTRAGGRLRPAWQAALWLVVIAKFALPWGPGLRFSLSDLIARLAVVLQPNGTEKSCIQTLQRSEDLKKNGR